MDITEKAARNHQGLTDACRRLAVVIPAYNAESTIEEVVRRTKSVSPEIKVIVVDDGSRDRTAEFARKASARVISHERNKGKGIALQTGFSKALSEGAEAVITLDADCQHAPEEIPWFVQKWLNSGADLIIGTREIKLGKMPAIRVLTNSLSSLLVSLLGGKRIKDSQSGYRLLSRRLINELPVKCPGYGAESEFVIKTATLGYKIECVPISTIYGCEKSYIHPVKQPLLFLGLILKSIVWRLEYIVSKGKKGPHTFNQR